MIVVTAVKHRRFSSGKKLRTCFFRLVRSYFLFAADELYVCIGKLSALFFFSCLCEVLVFHLLVALSCHFFK